MVCLEAARSKAAIAHFIGDSQMWQEAMWQLRSFYVEVECLTVTVLGGKNYEIKVKK